MHLLQTHFENIPSDGWSFARKLRKYNLNGIQIVQVTLVTNSSRSTATTNSIFCTKFCIHCFVVDGAAPKQPPNTRRQYALQIAEAPTTFKLWLKSQCVYSTWLLADNRQLLLIIITSVSLCSIHNVQFVFYFIAAVAAAADPQSTARKLHLAVDFRKFAFSNHFRLPVNYCASIAD